VDHQPEIPSTLIRTNMSLLFLFFSYVKMGVGKVGLNAEES
jgi:hypothetical protein